MSPLASRFPGKSKLQVAQIAEANGIEVIDKEAAEKIAEINKKNKKK